MTPEEAKRQSELEQAETYVTRQVPAMCWSMYNNLKAEGFKESQAFTLVIAYMLSSFSGGIKSQ